MENKENVRELIVSMLMEIYAGKEYSHILIKNVLDKYDYLGANDKSFMKRVTEGTLERGILIDYVLNSISTVKVNKMKPFIRCLLRMSVYQILFMDKVPDSAACNEAVKLATKHKFGSLKGFVNGVLRNVARNKDSIQYPDSKKDIKGYLSVVYSMPEKLVAVLLDEYGKDKTQDILAGILSERGLSIRIQENLPEAVKEAVLREWQEKQIKAKRHPWLPYAYQLKNTERIAALTGFQKGYYTVQDISSMLVCEIADIKAGDVVVDVCAAPGGKALHAADKLHGTGLVDARDVTEYKVNLLWENASRLNADNLKCKVWDATKKDDAILQKADVLLLDIPCSGMGVIGKKPDIKYRLNQDAFTEIQKLQEQIVNTVLDYVKPGGTLIYSTCTIRREENQDMVKNIIEKYPFELQSIDTYLPEELHNEETKKGQLLLLPTEANDGFFMARLKRKEG